jgi:hypothetical protein
LSRATISGGYVACRQLFEQVLLLEPVQGEVRRDRAGNVNDVEVEVGVPGLDGVRHGHPVAVVAEQVVGETELEVEVGPLVQDVPPGEPAEIDQRPAQAVEGVHPVPHVLGVQRPTGLTELAESLPVGQSRIAPQPAAELLLGRHAGRANSTLPGKVGRRARYQLKPALFLISSVRR